MTRPISIADRIERMTMPEPNSGCLLWTGAVNSRGYGSTTAGPGKRGTVQVHRAAFELARGPIPDGLVLDHLCRVRLCINPHHLEPVTEKENILRGSGVGAINARRTHCLLGHSYDSVDSNGRRQCRRCVLRLMREGHRRRNPRQQCREGYVKHSFIVRGVQDARSPVCVRCGAARPTYERPGKNVVILVRPVAGSVA